MGPEFNVNLDILVILDKSSKRGIFLVTQIFTPGYFNTTTTDQYEKIAKSNHWNIIY